MILATEFIKIIKILMIISTVPARRVLGLVARWHWKDHILETEGVTGIQ